MGRGTGRKALGGASIAVGLSLALAGGGCTSCRQEKAELDASTRNALGTPTVSSWPAASSSADSGASVPRPGMAWIPGGTLRAGTPPDRTPRVADEEMPGSSVEMSGFYIDLLPWPNEPNAIPTSNVSRDEAEQLCTAKNKRLCTELEWERACKGPENTTYEYGNAYRKEPCGTGIALELGARQPTGEHAQCKSGFGVSDMHGSVWEWTASSWGRGSRDASQGVLRGGNSPAGELVGRCTNAIARAPTKKSPTMGLRCCAGSKNVAEVKLDLRGAPGFTMASPARAKEHAPALFGAIKNGGAAIDPKSVHAWTWIPVANEELVVTMGCTDAPRSCAIVVARPFGDAGPNDVLATALTGKDLSDVTRGADARHIRIRSLDQRGVYSRELAYVYGRVDLGEPKRP